MFLMDFFSSHSHLECFEHVNKTFFFLQVKIGVGEKEIFMRKDPSGERGKRHRAIMDEECN